MSKPIQIFSVDLPDVGNGYNIVTTKGIIHNVAEQVVKSVLGSYFDVLYFNEDERKISVEITSEEFNKFIEYQGW
jgi:hypothetical protein